MNKERLIELYKFYGLEKDDVYKHKHYVIITRQGVEKVQAKEGLIINFEAVTSTPEYCVVKATARKGNMGNVIGSNTAITIETFGSAKYGKKSWNDQTKKYDESGNTSSWYVMEMVEKRALSRAVLKITGFYKEGVFSEDESEDFKKPFIVKK